MLPDLFAVLKGNRTPRLIDGNGLYFKGYQCPVKKTKQRKFRAEKEKKQQQEGAQMDICFQTDQKNATEQAAKRHYIILKNLYRSEKYISVKRSVNYNSKKPKQNLFCPPGIAPENTPF